MSATSSASPTPDPKLHFDPVSSPITGPAGSAAPTSAVTGPLSGTAPPPYERPKASLAARIGMPFAIPFRAIGAVVFGAGAVVLAPIVLPCWRMGGSSWGSGVKFLFTHAREQASGIVGATKGYGIDQYEKILKAEAQVKKALANPPPPPAAPAPATSAGAAPITATVVKGPNIDDKDAVLKWMALDKLEGGTDIERLQYIGSKVSPQADGIDSERASKLLGQLVGKPAMLNPDGTYKKDAQAALKALEKLRDDATDTKITDDTRELLDNLILRAGFQISDLGSISAPKKQPLNLQDPRIDQYKEIIQHWAKKPAGPDTDEVENALKKKVAELKDEERKAIFKDLDPAIQAKYGYKP